MLDSPQKSAIKQLSELRSLISQIGSAVSSATEPEQIKQLSELLKAAKQQFKNCRIEQNLATLTTKQLGALDGWTSGENKIIACCGTNRSGKSFVAGTIYAKYLRDDAPKNSEHLCVTTEQRLSAKNQQKMLWENIPHHLFDTEWSGPKNGFGTRNPTVVLDKGGRNVVVHFMTQSEFEANMMAFEGLTVETAWIDETITHELLSAVKARLALSDDGRALVSSIPASRSLISCARSASWQSSSYCASYSLLPTDRLTTIEASAEPIAPDRAAMEPPPGAGVSRETSSTKPATLRLTSGPSCLGMPMTFLSISKSATSLRPSD